MSPSPSMGTAGSADSKVGGSRRTTPNTGGSSSGPNQDMRMNGTTNSNTETNVNSTSETSGTTNSPGATSGAVPGLW